MSIKPTQASGYTSIGDDLSYDGGTKNKTTDDSAYTSIGDDQSYDGGTKNKTTDDSAYKSIGDDVSYDGGTKTKDGSVFTPIGDVKPLDTLTPDQVRQIVAWQGGNRSDIPVPNLMPPGDDNTIQDVLRETGNSIEQLQRNLDTVRARLSELEQEVGAWGSTTPPVHDPAELAERFPVRDPNQAPAPTTGGLSDFTQSLEAGLIPDASGRIGDQVAPGLEGWNELTQVEGGRGQYRGYRGYLEGNYPGGFDQWEQDFDALRRNVLLGEDNDVRIFNTSGLNQGRVDLPGQTPGDTGGNEPLPIRRQPGEWAPAATPGDGNSTWGIEELVNNVQRAFFGPSIEAGFNEQFPPTSSETFTPDTRTLQFERRDDGTLSFTLAAGRTINGTNGPIPGGQRTFSGIYDPATGQVAFNIAK